MKIGMLGPVYPYRGGIAHFTTLLANKWVILAKKIRADIE